MFIPFELNHLGNFSHPTYPFSLDLNYSFQVILFFASENLLLFQNLNQSEKDKLLSLESILKEKIILEIQTKYNDNKNEIQTEIDSQKQRIELLERNNFDQEKKDMWDD